MSRDQDTGVVLACDTCQHTWEPDPDDFDTGQTGCPRCGGWTWLAELAEPATVADPRSRGRSA